MKLPVYFELDGKFAAMLDSPDGGVLIMKDAGSPNIADFMASATQINYEDLPESMRQSVGDKDKLIIND